MKKIPLVNKKPILVIDTRERTPLDFSRYDDFGDVEYTKLDTGDYAIKGLENDCIVERKRDADELFGNFTTTKKRFFNEIERMKDAPLKFIVVQQSLEDILDPQSYYVNKRRGRKKFVPNMPPAVVLRELVEIMVHHDVPVIFAGEAATRIIRDILLRAVKDNKKGRFDG